MLSRRCKSFLFLSTRSSYNSDASATRLNEVLYGWPSVYRIPLNSLLEEISINKKYEIMAKSSSIDSNNWKSFIPTYRRLLMKNPLGSVQSVDELITVIDKVESIGDELIKTPVDWSNPDVSFCLDLLFRNMIAVAEKELGDEIKAYKSLCMKSDLRLPHEWYPFARIMKRKIIYHGGPTNSGKTYHAIQRLREADPSKGGGLYCGPLRLLALEIYEQLNRYGVYCDLLTGQEKREVPFATHISSTVEMVNLNRDYDVVVMDEIQMIADEHRGYAWTRVLHGVRAREIHVCGGSDAMNAVQAFAKDVGDDFEFRSYERLSPLQVSSESLRGDYSLIRPGDCVVAFSKADIFSIKKAIEKLTPHKCCMIYGQLPAETRSTQARLFNEENTGFDVLVASDAIGMGLNLNIKRIVFHTTIKDGSPTTGPQWIHPSFIRQIAGRAGRLSSDYKFGEVACWQEGDLSYIRAAMAWELPQITSIGLFPSVDQIVGFADFLYSSDMISANVASAVVDDDRDANNNNSEERVDEVIISNLLETNSNNDITVTIGNNNTAHDENSNYFMNTDSMAEAAVTLISATTSNQQHKITNNDKIDVLNTNLSNLTDDLLHTSTTTTTTTGSANNTTATTPISIPHSPSPTPSLIDDNHHHLKIRLSSLLKRFVDLAQMDGRYFLCEHETMIIVSNWLHTIPLKLADRFTFSIAPVSIRDHMSMSSLYSFAASYALGRPVALNVRMGRRAPRDVFELSDFCGKHNVLDLYLWLSYRFPKYFIERDLCLEQKAYAITMIDEALHSPFLKQKHCHIESYEKTRMKANNSTSLGGLPPEAWGNVRERTQLAMDAVPKDLRYVYPRRNNNRMRNSIITDINSINHTTTNNSVLGSAKESTATHFGDNKIEVIMSPSSSRQDILQCL